MVVLLNFEDWNEYLSIKGLSKRTIYEYNIYYDLFCNECALFDKASILNFLNKYNQSVGRAFLRNLFVYIKTYSTNKEYIEIIKDIILPSKTGRKRKRLPQQLTLKELASIGEHLNDERNKLMLLISFYGGLRVSELISLTFDNFSLESWKLDPRKNGILTVIGKGDKEREIYLPSKLMSRIYQFQLSFEPDYKGDLFNIGKRRWTEILHKASEKCLKQPIHPHDLRSSCANWLYEKGFDIKAIKEFLGHENISTTDLYFDTKTKLKEKYNKLVQPTID